jgi:PAS domain S-box-containing protein
MLALGGVDVLPQPAETASPPAPAASPDRRPDLALTAAGALCGAVGWLALAGWHLHAPALFQLSEKWTPVQYNTALSFVLCGVALMALARERRRVTLSCGALVLIAAAMTGAEYIFAIDLHIDRLLFEPWLNTPAAHPGRMAPNTALSLLGGSVSLLLIVWRGHGRVRLWIATPAAALTLALPAVAMAGYAASLGAAYGWGMERAMALPTAIALVALGAGLLRAAWREGSREQVGWVGSLAPAVTVGFGSAALLLWRALQIEQRAQITPGAPGWWAPDAALLLAVVAGAGLAYVVHKAGFARERNRQLEDMNLLLEQAIAERRRTEDELTRTNRALQMVNECNQALVRATTEEELLQRICKLAVSVGGYRLAWVGYREEDEARSVRVVCQSGPESAYVEPGTVTWADDECGRDPAGTAIRTGEPEVCPDVRSVSSFAPWRERALRHELGSSIAVPLLDAGRALGALSIYAAQPHAFDQAEIRLLTELGGDLAFGIRALRTRAEHRAAERRLQEQAALLELAPVAIFVRNLDGRIAFWSKGADAMYGWSAEETLGRTTDAVLSTEYQQSVAEIEAAVAERETWEGELVHRCRDGRRITVASRWALRHDADGVPAGYLEVNLDITERQRVEEALERYAAELKRSNAELQDFAYIASHDLQEPLRKISAFGDRLREHCGDSLDQTSRDYLGRMLNSSARMAALIEGLLQYSRVASRPETMASVDLVQVIFEVVADLEERMQACGARLQVEALPRLRADRMQMHQLLQNLIANALKFHRPGVAPEVRVRWRHAGEDWIELFVADNGIGFDESYASRLFRPFQRLHGRGEYEGSGMGLAICRKIAERHGGSIVARSAPGEGSTFIVRLPANLCTPERVTAARSGDPAERRNVCNADPNRCISCLPKMMMTTIC